MTTKVEDTKQEYALSMMGPSYVSPSGNAFEFHETEDNERLVIKHASGSHMEFKADGSIIIKSLGDMVVHDGVVSNQAGGFDGTVKGADSKQVRTNVDYTWEVGGRLRIKCQQLDLEVGNTALIKAGRDIKVEANNIVQKAGEQISMEATKSIYMDAKEKKERFTTTRMETGTEEYPGGLSEAGGATPIGGMNVINVTGNTIIENSDPSGGITISSAGYLNLVCGQERVDITGKWGPMSTGKAPAFMPGKIAKPFSSTFTNLVFDPMKGVPDPKMQYNAPPGTGGSYFHMSENSSVYQYALTGFTAPMAKGNGHLVNVMLGNKTENVMTGNRFRNVTLNEFVNITGIQMIRAKLIFLN